MVVDAHIHLTENGKWFYTDHKASPEYYLKITRDSIIEKALILPIHPVMSNRFVHKVCTENKGKFIGFASLDPAGSNAPTLLKRDIKKFNLKGLKLHPKIQEFSLLSPNVLYTIEAAVDLEIPVLIDTWFEDEKIHAKYVKNINNVVRLFPKLKLILPHLGGPNPHTLFEHRDVFFDLSFILSRVEDNIIPYFDQMLKVIGPSRLIYGSDFPEMNPLKYLKLAEGLLDKVKISSADKDKIFRTNILELCGVE